MFFNNLIIPVLTDVNHENIKFDHLNKSILKYLFYYLKNNVKYFREKASGMGALPQISLGVTDNFVIPLPTLEKQKEIVAILDKCDSLCNDLTAGLPAEIEHRQKQYEYYRDKLLTFWREI